MSVGLKIRARPLSFVKCAPVLKDRIGGNESDIMSRRYNYTEAEFTAAVMSLNSGHGLSQPDTRLRIISAITLECFVQIIFPYNAPGVNRLSKLSNVWAVAKRPRLI